MIRALSTAATGLEAQQSNIERISNDLANVNTDGYKRSRTEFHDLMYQTLKEPGAALGATTQTPSGIQIGTGVKVGTTHKIFEQGPAKMTYNPFDFMIEGQGFFQVTTAQGETAYSRSGSFRRDAQGIIRLSNGAALNPQIQVPPNSQNVMINPQGEVRAQLATGEDVVIGQLQLATFQNDEGLSAMGEGMYRRTNASGPALVGIPGENGLGSIQQGALEGSNVNVATSMVDMIQTQRSYEMNTKVFKTADEMLGGLVNTVK